MSTQLSKLMYCTALLLAIAGSLVAQEDTRVFKPYKPFDDPKPKLGAQINEDTRLDVKVTVRVKSLNMRALFDELGKATGVKLVVARGIWAERPIVYMHNRPLRDVMIEVANLYGYYWLVRGKPGEWSYELFQDLRHAQQRERLAREKKAVLDNCILESIRKGSDLLDDPETMRKAQQDNPLLVEALTNPANRDSVRILSMIDESILARALTEGSATFRAADLPGEWQQAMLEALNADLHRREDERRAKGEEAREYAVFDVADILNTDVSVRSRMHNVFGMPSLVVSVFPSGPSRIRGSEVVGRWPMPMDSSVPELDQLAEMADPGTAAEKVIGDSLPAEAKITIEKGSRVEYGYAVRFGDALEAIADQAKVDVIADYYYQRLLTGMVKEKPVKDMVKELCSTFGYTCQVEKATLRLRFNSWFEVSLMQEPPAGLVERIWTSIETLGRVTIEDVLEVSRLPEEQYGWGGFRFIPGVREARLSPSTLRLMALLTPAQSEQAKTEAGLGFAELTAEQQEKCFALAKVFKPLLSITEIVQSRLLIGIVESGSTSYTLTVMLPDGSNPSSRFDLPSPLVEKDRKELADQRKADTQADRIELADSR